MRIMYPVPANKVPYPVVTDPNPTKFQIRADPDTQHCIEHYGKRYLEYGTISMRYESYCIPRMRS